MRTMGKKIALYGGSFDPPHLGHVITITAILNSSLVDEIWLVPTGLHRDKDHHASVDDRKAMISVMLATMFGSKVPVYLNNTQIDRYWEVSTTINLLEEMRKKNPKNQFYFVIGTDLIKEIPKWNEFKKLKAKGLFLAVQRLGAEVVLNTPSYVKIVKTKNLALTNISSSLVRTMIMNGQSLEGIVPPSVISHIIRNGLYKYTKILNRTGPHIISEGRFIRFLSEGGWEYVERNNCNGIVVIVALTADDKVLFTEQYRLPVKTRAIEFPAGLVNDGLSKTRESLESAARRELLEETGYEAQEIKKLIKGPISSGLTSETITFLMAKRLKKVSAGGGDDTESIKVHEVPLTSTEKWLKNMEKKGCVVDPKIYAGLYFLNKARGKNEH